MIVITVEMCRNYLEDERKRNSIEDVCEHLADMFEISSKRLTNLYYELKKDPEVIKALDR